MHYVISYDLENDRLRGKVAKLLARHGCERVQKSVFVAPYLERKHLRALETALRRALTHAPAAASDSILLIPVDQENAADIRVFGNNNILAHLAPPTLKIRI